MSFPKERVLLIKYGQKLGFQRKRYCEVYSDGVLAYFENKDSKKPKGSFKICAPVEFFLEASFLKSFESCIRIKIQERRKTKQFWLFPIDSKIKETLLNVFNAVNNNNNKKNSKTKAKRSNSQNFNASQIIKNNVLNLSFDTLNQKKHSFHEDLTDENDVFLKEKPIVKQKTLLEESQVDLIEEFKQYFCEDDVTLEGRLPTEIKEISNLIVKKSHESFFKESYLDETAKYSENQATNPKEMAKKLRISSISDNNLNNFKETGRFVKNSRVFTLYQENKDADSHKFLFPKREDNLNLEILGNLELSDDFLLNLAEQFLWEFQLENAQRIFLLKPKNLDYSTGLLEISLMKVLVSGKRSLIDSLLSSIQETLAGIIPCDHNYIILSEISMVKGMLYTLLQSKFQAFIAFRESYNLFKKAEKSNSFASNPLTYSRFLLISGAFKIGFSLLPSQYRKILEILGLATDRNLGIKALKECISQGKIRANFARLLLGLYYIEGDNEGSFDLAFELIKESLKTLNKSPLMNWMASLFSWRFMQGSESIKLILRSLANIGGDLSKEAYYLKFELAWFEMSRCQWNSALTILEELAIVSLDLFNFDDSLFMKIRPKNIEVPEYFINLIKKAKTMENSLLENYPINKGSPSKIKGPSYKTIIMPHRNTLALIIAICYVNMNEQGLCEYWLAMTDYIERKFANDPVKSSTDNEIASLSRKFRKRTHKFLIKYEVLYFLKEISKLKDNFLLQIQKNINEFFRKTFDFDIKEHKNIMNHHTKRLCIINEYASVLFLLIIIQCLLRNFKEVLDLGLKLKEIIEFISKDYEYLLHHGFHWVGRSLLINEEKKKANEFLKLSRKYQDCDFSLKAKNAKFLKETST